VAHQLDRVDRPGSGSGGPLPPASPQVTWTTLRTLPLFRDAGDAMLRELLDAGLVRCLEVPRDTLLVPPDGLADALCVVADGQVSIGVFERRVLTERGRAQRDAALGEKEGTLLPPGPMAQAALKNLALFGEGELFNLTAIPEGGAEDVVAPFSLSRATVVIIASAAVDHVASAAPPVERAIAAALALTNARLRMVTGVKNEILDFYLRNGLSVAGPTVRLRQLDLCIDCKQCEDACEDRHGSRRLTLGGFELGVLDFVFSCRTCADARCLSPCEHDAIKRDMRTGEVKIIEDKCIGCSLCALSCPYGAIDMVNVAEPEMPSFMPRFKDRLEKANKLGFGPGKGRKAPARRIANKCDHCADYGDQACVSACPTGALIEIAPAVLFRERPEPTGKRKKRLNVLPSHPFTEGLNIRDSGEARVKTRKVSLLLWFLGLGSFLGVLTEIALRWYHPTWSVSYQLLLRDGLEPEIAEMNVSFLAGTKLALTCGYVGTALMTLSMAYLLQRRFGWFHKTATNQFWLDVHIMTGLVGPLFILLHSALRLSTWVSIPFWSMVAVVVSGFLGRYLYTLVPALTSKHDLQILEQRRAITEVAREHPEAVAKAHEILDREAHRSERTWSIGLFGLLLWVLVDDLRRSWSMRSQRRQLRKVAPRKIARQLARHVDRVIFFERRKALAPRSKVILRSWKRVHIPFSVVLLVTMIAHIVIALAYS
jgi:Fe-S-cluster-containing hydrogenase component 2